MTNEKRVGAVTAAADPQNTLITGGYQKDFRFENIIDAAKFQSDLTDVLTKRPPKIIKCIRCYSCAKPYAPFKMSKVPNVCQKCLEAARTKPIRDRRRFVDAALNNFHKFLRNAVAI